ncbi:MAG: metallophosphoesterase, partial [Candidatus Freyarchaeota archaeon]|nr:metallophosphoesterase [Candidatus Jordarchaeia archaeon]
QRGGNPMVVVSHEPPRGCCDKAWSGMNIGNKHLRSFVESVMPELVFCGHVHEARGQCQLGASIVVNVGKCSEGGAVATIKEGSVDVELL